MIASQAEAGPKYVNYVGIAMASLVGMNLTAKELLETGVVGKERYEETKHKPVKYTSDTDGKYRLDFHFKIEEPTPYPVYVRVSVYIGKNTMAPGRVTGKLKVINATQNFAWVSPEDLAAQAPQISAKSTDGKPWFEGPYRLALEGEEELYNLLKLVAGVNRDKAVSKVDFNQVMTGKYHTIGNVLSGENRRNSFIKLMLGEQITESGARYQCAWKTPMSQYAQDNVYQRIHSEINAYLDATSKLYEYGIGRSYSVADMVFRPADQLAQPSGYSGYGTPPAVSKGSAMPESEVYPESHFLHVPVPITPGTEHFERQAPVMAGDSNLPTESKHDDDLPF